MSPVSHPVPRESSRMGPTIATDKLAPAPRPACDGRRGRRRWPQPRQPPPPPHASAAGGGRRHRQIRQRPAWPASYVAPAAAGTPFDCCGMGLAAGAVRRGACRVAQARGTGTSRRLQSQLSKQLNCASGASEQHPQPLARAAKSAATLDPSLKSDAARCDPTRSALDKHTSPDALCRRRAAGARTSAPSSDSASSNASSASASAAAAALDAAPCGPLGL
jgi:hypothetical protein